MQQGWQDHAQKGIRRFTPRNWFKTRFKSIFTLFFYFALTKTSHNNFWLEERSGDGSKNCVYFRMHGLYQNNCNFRVCVLACWGRVLRAQPRHEILLKLKEFDRQWGLWKKYLIQQYSPTPNWELSFCCLKATVSQTTDWGDHLFSIFALPTTTWANLAFSRGNQTSNQRLGRA